uniref:O-methyltransferase C-terminal domain-containing protein n=1 Tax=Salix viminalis TaxID=40686 RepID=A0A6N2ND39_SALVM
MIVSKYPAIKGINFDLASVIENSPSYPGIEHVAGDVFLTIPEGEAIFMKWVSHFFSDDNFLKVLKNCYGALPDNGKLIVVEMVIPEIPGTSAADRSLMQNYLFVTSMNPKRNERTEKDFERLAKVQGFLIELPVPPVLSQLLSSCHLKDAVLEGGIPFDRTRVINTAGVSAMIWHKMWKARHRIKVLVILYEGKALPYSFLKPVLQQKAFDRRQIQYFLQHHRSTCLRDDYKIIRVKIRSFCPPLTYSSDTNSENRQFHRLYGLAPVTKNILKKQNGGYHLKDAVLEGVIPFDKAHLNVTETTLEIYDGSKGDGDGSIVNMIISKYPSIKASTLIWLKSSYPGINFGFVMILQWITYNGNY